MQFSRRQFIKSATLAAAGLGFLKLGKNTVYAAANSPNLRKWVQDIRGLTGADSIPLLQPSTDPHFSNCNFYEVTAGEFMDQLHPDLGPTTLWGYWDSNTKVKRHLGGLVVARRGRASRLRFTNELPDRHIIPVDTTLPGANQPQNRIAIHLHGGLVPWISDGGPFDWWTPAGPGYATGLSFLNGPQSVLDNIPGKPMHHGQADYYYPNDQSTRLVWYHDHAHGITRINAYAGLASGYLILDAINDAYVAAGRIPAGVIPLIFQDKVFVGPNTLSTDPTWADVARTDLQSSGSLWYEHVYDPAVFALNPPAGAPELPNPSCIPEFFGDTMLCNGTVYPVLTVEAKRYRFSVLNACNARFLNINLFRAKPNNPDGIVLDPVLQFPMNPPGPKMIQIGTEGGFLQQEVTFISPKPFNPLTLAGNLIVAPAERVDMIIDFSKNAGDDIIMYNDAPGPFPGGAPDTDYYLGNPLNPVQPLPGTGPDTRQILRIRVIPARIPDPKVKPGPILDPGLVDPPLLVKIPKLVPVPPLPIPAGVPTRDLSLNEDFDEFGRLAQKIGTLIPKEPGAAGLGRDYLDPSTENPTAGAVEVWRIHNLTADTHPMHFHLVNVQVLQREAFTGDGLTTPIVYSGVARGPELNELGWKETVQCHPGEVITMIMKFDLPAVPFSVPPSPRTGGHEYVWHCHILEHEEHDMMRPIVVS
jgi:spore coat protein A, manganese oxidase